MSIGRALWVAALVAASAVASSVARAQPEMRGSFTVETWDAGMVAAGGGNVRTRVYYPSSAPGPFPVVAVIHGASSMGAFLAEMAQTLTSRGFVTVVPDMPCSVFGCDHGANAMIISGLLQWAVDRGADGTSPIAGRVDGSRRGVIGHSFGGLNSAIATSRDATIGSAVYLDPNDDAGGPGFTAASGVHVPAALVSAQVKGACNSAWLPAAFDRFAGPKLALTITGSGHCDVEDSTNPICVIACTGGGGGNALFRRYAVAFTACVLAADPAVAGWVRGAEIDADVAGGRVNGVSSSGLDTLPCFGVTPTDAGVPPGDDAGSTLDAGIAADGGSSASDAGPPPTGDAGTSAPLDAGPGHIDAGPGGSGGHGCGCTVAGARDRDLSSTWLALLAALLVARRRRR